MSNIKVEITEDHIKLARQLIFSSLENVIFAAEEENGSQFGGDDLLRDIEVILEGVPEGGIDPFDDVPEITEEKKEYYEKLYAELPTVLEIILGLATFETGHYKRRFHIRRGSWKKYTPKADDIYTRKLVD